MKYEKLGNLTSIQTGKIDVNKAVVGGKYPFFTCSRDVYEINDAPFEGKAVLVAGNGDLNVKYYEGKFNAYQRTYFLFVNDENELIPRYLYWFLESYVDQLRTEAIGSTIKYIKMGNLTEAEIPLPSLETQQEIVEKLDSAIVEIELLEKNLGLGDENTNQLFQSLLNSAFSFTTDENKSSNASGDDSISTNLLPLGTVAEVIAGQSPEGIYYNSNGDGVPFYQGKKEFGDKFLGAPTTWTTKITKLAQSGDILMSVRAPVGPINFSTQEICIGRGLASIRASKLVNKDFLFYFLLHKQPEISGNTGAVFDSINKEQIASIELPVPSLEKQREIVEKLESAFAEIELLKAQIRIEKEYALALRQSLLSSAFTKEEAVA
jgi:type I restriction enzyme S subunit